MLSILALESYRKRGGRLFALLSPLTMVSARREQITEESICDGYCIRPEWSHNVVCYHEPPLYRLPLMIVNYFSNIRSAYPLARRTRRRMKQQTVHL